jgi:putative ABC transport system ATP-binding protein
MSPIVELKDVARRFGNADRAIDVLRDVDLRIDAGEFVVLLGPSGSGKTTLLNIVGGIDTASDGRVEVAGHDLDGLDGDALAQFRRDCVGFVFQFFNLVPTLTALENVELMGELTGAETDDGTALLREVGLGERLDEFPATLSGGEQQRVAIARALVKRPALLLCDEPTGALDLDTGRVVLDLLHRVTRERHATVLLVSHNQAIGRMADRVLHLHRGEIARDERVEHPVPALELDW